MSERLECSVAEDLIPLYIGEDVSAGTALWLEQHLADCVRCRSVLDETGGVRSELVLPEPRSSEQSLEWELIQKYRGRNRARGWMMVLTFLLLLLLPALTLALTLTQ